MRSQSTLEAFRRLDDDLKSGTIGRAEFQNRRRALKDAVEDAVASEPSSGAGAASPHDIPSVGRMAVAILVALAVATLLGAWLLRDLLLALTLAVTGLAALTVRAFKGLD